jgi:hypothetical protein
VSRAKKARARRRRHAAEASQPAPSPATAPAKPKPRVEAARRRIAAAKLGVAGVALVGFAAALGFARISYAGHSKKPLRPLSAPPRYVEIVRQNLLQAGIVAPTQAPPGAATSTS